ncbi:MAG: elongation factor G, partial [Candidatus Onthomonas sp.]|nr:elongation factor G [Candidatus Onthomonas sp.]
MSYSAQNIRNICLLGHSGVGKTMLVESMLNLTGATDRLGKTADGNTVCDYDPEEIKRQISISTALAPVEFKDCKINVLDTPGNFDFNGDVLAALQVADAAVIVLPAKGDISVGAERAYKEIKARNLPCLIYVSKTDEDNGDFNAVVEKLKEKIGTSVTPLVIPKFEGEKVTGVIDVVAKKAYSMNKNKTVAEDVPADAADLVEESYAALMENVAETSEELMEKFFDGEEFTAEEIASGLRVGVKEGSLIPVFCGSAFSGLGTEAFMNGVIDLVPDPTQGIPAAGVDADGEAVEVAVADGDPVAFVFKTVSDQYGKYSYIKVLAGPFTSDSAVVNSRTGDNEKMGRLYTMRGKKATEVKSLVTGDIGAIAKMDKVKTNDTLSAKGIALNPIPFAEPVFSKAIAPKTRGQEDKIGTGLNRLNEEDPSFSVTNNAETHQMVVAGAGDIQIDVLVAKLKSRFGVEAVLDTPRVAYREKIRKTVSKQGKFKKQTGGSGQYGDVWVRFEPCDEEEMVFDEEVFGGSVPRNYFPAVEKGLREACLHGVLAGYPVVNLKAV